MKKYQYIFAALLAIAACQKNEVAPETIDEEPVWGYITAVAEVPQTKALLEDADGDGNLDYAWTVGDKLTILVYKGNDDTPGYARREASISSVSDGVATIKYEKGTGKNEATKIAGAWYPVRNNNDNLPDQSVPVSQDFSKGRVAIPLVADNVSMVSPMDPGDGVNEGGKVYDSKTTLHFSVNPAIGTDGYSVLGFRLKKGGAERTIKSIKVNNGSQDYTLTNINTALTDDVQYFYIVLPASDTPLSNFKATITANDGVNDLEYTRTKSSYTPTAGKVTRFPVISDMDETGKHIWFMGSGSATANSAETPILYWWKQKGANNSTTIDTPVDTADDDDDVKDNGDVVYNDGFTTIKMADKATSMTDFQAWVCASFNKMYSTDGESVTNVRNASFPVYVTENANGQAPFVAVHSGNYPIFAIKMSNPANYGSSRKIRFQTDSREALDGVAAGIFVDSIGNGDNKYSYLEGFSDKDDTVIYYDLSTANIGGKGVLPNTKIIPFKTWQLRFYDVHYDSAQGTAPTFNLYWAGFFNSVPELTTFASSH